MIRSRTLHAISLASFVALAIGCAPAATDDAESNGDAISHEEAAKELSLTQLVLADEPAGASAKELGITQWHVYVSTEKSFNGTVAFATDAEKAFATHLRSTPQRATPPWSPMTKRG